MGFYPSKPRMEKNPTEDNGTNQKETKTDELNEKERTEDLDNENELPDNVIHDKGLSYQRHDIANKRSKKLIRLRDGMPEHPLIQGRYIFVKDHYDGIDILGTQKKIGAPNFRQAGSNYNVYGFGQPTCEGLENILYQLVKSGKKVKEK